MCGRFLLHSPPAELSALFGFADQPNLQPRYNIAPTQTIVAVSPQGSERRLISARWGLIPAWTKDCKALPLLINARAETARDKPAFRSAMRKGRCLIPANGWYEWQGEGRSKQPYLIQAQHGGIIAFAGLSECWRSPEGEEVHSLAILTTEANAELKPIHHRMPVVLSSEIWEAWLDPKNPADEVGKILAQPQKGPFTARPVSTQVNAVRNDDIALIAQQIIV